jgi:hypothetical protein
VPRDLKGVALCERGRVIWKRTRPALDWNPQITVISRSVWPFNGST